MKFSIEKDGEVAIFHVLEERLDSTNAAQVKTEFLILLQTGISILIVECSAVTFCDSSGLGALLLAERQLREKEGGVLIVDPTGKVKNLIDIVQLTKVLPVFPTMDDARAVLEDDDA